MPKFTFSLNPDVFKKNNSLLRMTLKRADAQFSCAGGLDKIMRENVCERVSERERERECVCVWESVCVYVRVRVSDIQDKKRRKIQGAKIRMKK